MAGLAIIYASLLCLAPVAFTIQTDPLSFENHDPWRLQNLTKVSRSSAPGSCPPLAIEIASSLETTATLYVTGLDGNQKHVFIDQENSHWILPNVTSSSPSLIQDPQILHTLSPQHHVSVVLPDCLSSARLWVTENDTLDFGVVGAPNGAGSTLVEPSLASQMRKSYTYMEFNYDQSGLVANPTYVDMVSRIPLSFEVESTAGSTFVRGMRPNALRGICTALKKQESVDHWPWSHLCVKTIEGANDWIRVLSPRSFLAMEDAGAFDNYFENTVDLVWRRFSANDSLSIGSAQLNTACTIDSITQLMKCAASGCAFQRPSTRDIFSCSSGPFANQGVQGAGAIISNLAAAFNRGTLMLASGRAQPTLTAGYYPMNGSHVFNWYSKIVHEWQRDGKGYAFPYDDVVDADGADSSGLVNLRNPTKLSVWLGDEQ